jgi:hypothetical protein
MAGITLKETDDTLVPTPASGKATIFVDDADGLPKYKDDTGTVSTLGGGGSAAWGAITGTLTDQTDLVAALALKVPTSRTVNGLALSANITLSASDLGLVIGTNVQAYDATLAALAGANWAANAFPIGTAADTVSQVSFAANTFPARASSGNLVAKTISDDALSLLAAANYAAMRTALGVPGLADANTWTAQNTFAVGTITASAPTQFTQTWNNGAVLFEALLVNITDTSSSASSLLANLKIGGSTKFSIDKTGITKLLELQAISGSGILRLGSNLFTDRVGITSGSGCTMNVGTATVCDDSGAAETLALRRSTNAQKLRVYRTFSDASNYERVAIQTGSGYVELAAETAGTGTDDIDIRLTPAGTGKVRFGSHSAIAAETVTGYITIVDSGGTSRKIAVVS